MVRPTRKVAGQTMLQGQARCQQRAADGQIRALHQRSGDRQADTTLRLTIEPIPRKRFVILTVMDQFQQAARHRKGTVHLHISGQPRLSETTVELAKFRHRKTMTAGERCAVGLVINEWWFQRFNEPLNSEESEAGCDAAGQVTQLAKGL